MAADDEVALGVSKAKCKRKPYVYSTCMQYSMFTARVQRTVESMNALVLYDCHVYSKVIYPLVYNVVYMTD